MALARRIAKIVGIIASMVVITIAGILGFASIRWDAKIDRQIRPLIANRDSATMQRGEFLFKTSLTCWLCHSSGNPTVPPSGGMKFDLTTLSPSLGVYYAANITPDVETGIGGWTDGEIVRAIREGVRQDGRVLFPIMPVDPLNGLSDDDALALVAYLRSLPPVKNRVAPKEPSLFAKTLLTLGVVGPSKELTAPVVAPPRGITAVYGEYVARHASLCSDCHTPRDLKTGAFYYDSLMAGSSINFGSDDEGSSVLSFAANITPDEETGIGSWTEEQFLTMLRMGVGADGKVRSMHMPYAYYGLWDSLELKAVYQYLRTLQPVRRTTSPSEYVGDAIATEPAVKGKGLFNATCVACHGAEGKGAPPTNVALAEVAPGLEDADLTAFIREGNMGLRMPAFGKTLSADDMNAVVAYIRSWSDK